MPKTVLKFDIEGIDDIVESNPEYQKQYEEFQKAIKRFENDIEIYDSIEAPAMELVIVTQSIAFKAGFAEGIRYITGIMADKEALSHK